MLNILLHNSVCNLGDASTRNSKDSEFLNCLFFRIFDSESEIQLLDVMLAFVACLKMDRLFLFHRLFAKYKKTPKSKEAGNLKELFSCLIDAEISLRAGCVNEYLETTFYILESYGSFGIHYINLALFNRAIVVYLINRKEVKNPLYLSMPDLAYFDGSNKLGQYIEDKNEVELTIMDDIRDDEAVAKKIISLYKGYTEDPVFTNCSSTLLPRVANLIYNNVLSDDE